MHNPPQPTYAAQVAKHQTTISTMRNQRKDTSNANAITTTVMIPTSVSTTATTNDDSMKLLMDQRLLAKLQSLRTLLLPRGMSSRRGRISLPMDAGRLYHDYILVPQTCDVRQSSYKNLSHWLRILERDGYIRTSIRMHKPHQKGRDVDEQDDSNDLNTRTTHMEQVRAQRRNRGTPVKMICHIASPQQVLDAREKTVKLKKSEKAKLFEWIKDCCSDLTPTSGVLEQEDDLLLYRLLNVSNTQQVPLPMQANQFYERYILDHQRREVKHSSFQKFNLWLSAMEAQNLVAVEKQRTATRKKVQVIVALGSEAVEQYIAQSTKPSTLFDWDSLSELQDSEHDEVPDMLVSKHSNDQNDESTTQSDSSISQVSDQSAVDHLLVQSLLNFTAHEELPMDLSNFYQRFVLSQGCNIHESSYPSVSKWAEAMECNGLVLVKTKRTGRKHQDTKVVVAAGFEAVQRMQRSLPPSLPPPLETTVYQNSPSSNNNRRLETNADLIDEDAGQIALYTTPHARDRQKQRNISNSEIEATLTKKGTRVTRLGNGLRKYMDFESGITVVARPGGLNKVISAWKENSHVSQEVMERWSGGYKDDMNDHAWHKEGRPSTVTVIQTYARYQKKPGATLKWKEGDLIRKKKRFRVILVIVGLDDELVMAAKSQIQNQIGCCCSLGTLHYAEWYDSYGQIDPLAENGSKIISTQIAAQSRVLTNIMTLLEAVTPLGTRRRYLRESLSHAIHGKRVWVEDTKNVDKQAVESNSNVEQCEQADNYFASDDFDGTKDSTTDTTSTTDCSSSSVSSTTVEKPESPKIDIFGEEYTPSDDEEDGTNAFVDNRNNWKHEDETIAEACVIS